MVPKYVRYRWLLYIKLFRERCSVVFCNLSKTGVFFFLFIKRVFKFAACESGNPQFLIRNKQKKTPLKRGCNIKTLSRKGVLEKLNKYDGSRPQNKVKWV